jgi:hypothetical protein
VAVDGPKQVHGLVLSKVPREKETGTDFQVSAQQYSSNNGGLVYKVNSVMMVVLATTETFRK